MHDNCGPRWIPDGVVVNSNFLVLLNLAGKIYDGNILKETSGIAKLLKIKIPSTIKALKIYLDFSTAFFNVLSRIFHHLNTFKVIQSLLQCIIVIRENSIHGCDIELSYGYC